MALRQDSHWRVTDLRHEGSVTRWTLLRGGEPFAELDAADGGRAQCAERDGGGGAGGGAGRSGGGDRGGAGDVPAREAAAGGAGRGERHHRSSTTSRTIRRRFARRCVRCGRRIRAGGCGRCWSRARTRCGAMCLRRRWSRAWRWRTAVVLAEVFKSEAIPASERLHPENVVAALRARGRRGGAVCGCGRDCGGDCAGAAAGRCGGDPVERRLRRDL